MNACTILVRVRIELAAADASAGQNWAKVVLICTLSPATESVLEGKDMLPFLPLSPSGCMCFVTLCPLELYLGREPLRGPSSAAALFVGVELHLGSWVKGSGAETGFRLNRPIVDGESWGYQERMRDGG